MKCQVLLNIFCCIALSIRVHHLILCANVPKTFLQSNSKISRCSLSTYGMYLHHL